MYNRSNGAFLYYKSSLEIRQSGLPILKPFGEEYASAAHYYAKMLSDLHRLSRPKIAPWFYGTTQELNL